MDKIKQNLVYLADNLINMERILLYLIENDIISLNESDDIEEGREGFNQNAKMLKLILRKDFPINIFLEILRNTQNGRCADKIEGLSRDPERKLQKPKILKSLWWKEKKVLIKSLHRRKSGDKFLIQELHEKLSADENRMLVICESWDASKLTGLGGVGKTLTATWYADHYENEYDHVIWIDSGENTLLDSFETLARDLDIRNRQEILKVEELARKCYQTLEEFKCLWIFDNAESYRGDDGIKEVLPICKTNFYCLITSRWREWGTENIGYGQISRFELNIFGDTESLDFFKVNLKQEIKYTEDQLKELCLLLGNLPLAMQLAVAALNMGKIDLKNYIEKTPIKDLENIVDTPFDAYEKTINGSVKITLELINKEEGGTFAKEILNVFGYIRPDNVEMDFLTTIFISQSDETILANAIQLLTKYSLITQLVGENGQTTLSIHRLLQQVIRHNGRTTEKGTLRNILACKGFVGHKLLPFIKYADEELRKEFPKVKAELLDQRQLVRLVKENRFQESVHLSKFIDKELQRNTTKFNYAICLEMNGQWENNVTVLEELYREEMREEIGYYDYYDSVEMGLLELKKEVTKCLVGGHLLVSLWTMDNNNERLKEILEERKSFVMIPSGERMTPLVRILYSNLIHSNYTLTIERGMLKLVLRGDEKRIVLNSCYFYLSGPLLRALSEMQKSLSERVHSTDGNPKDTKSEVSQGSPKILNTVKVHCYESDVSLESISFIENITLYECSLSLDSVNRISPTELILNRVSFYQNGQEVSNVKINEFIDFRKMKRLALICWAKNLSIDLSKESANIEYLQLYNVDVFSLKSANGNGRVNIKEAIIGDCSLYLSILPPSLEKLSLSSLSKVFVSGAIDLDLPNLKYLKLDNKAAISQLSHFRCSLPLLNLHLKWPNVVDVKNTHPLSPTIIGIEKESRLIEFKGGIILNLDKLILDEFPLNIVKQVLPHFHTKILVLHHSYNPSELPNLMGNQKMKIAIGKVVWGADGFQNSIISKQVDRQSEYYIFHEGKGKFIEKQDFDMYCNFSKTILDHMSLNVYEQL